MKNKFTRILLCGLLMFTVLMSVKTPTEAAPADWDTMVANVQLLEEVAQEYITLNGLSSLSARKITLGYIRTGRYSSIQFNLFLSTPNSGFETYVNANYPALADLRGNYDLVAPTSETIDVVHLFATMEGVLVNQNTGDLLGWGGDAASLAVGLRAAGVSNADAPSVAIARFLSESYSFGATDWRSDLDAYNITQILTASGNESLTIAQAMNIYYASIMASPENMRVDYFVRSRFGALTLGEDTYKTTINSTLGGNGLLTVYYSTNGNPNSTLRKAVYDAIGSYLYSVIYSIYNFNFSVYTDMYVGSSQTITATPDGSPLFASYSWTVDNATRAVLTNVNTDTVTISAIAEGNIVVSLTMGGQTKTLNISITKKEIVVDNVKYVVVADGTAHAIEVLNNVENITIPASVTDGGVTFAVSSIEAGMLEGTNVKQVAFTNTGITLEGESLYTGNASELKIFVPEASDITNSLKNGYVTATTKGSNGTNFSVFALDTFDLNIDVANQTHVLDIDTAFAATVSSIIYSAIETYEVSSVSWLATPSATAIQSVFTTSWSFGGNEISTNKSLSIPSLAYTDNGSYKLSINGYDKGEQFILEVVDKPTISVDVLKLDVDFGITPLSESELITRFGVVAENYLGLALPATNISVSGVSAINYNVAGDYVITFTVTDANGRQSNVSATVTVLPKQAIVTPEKPNTGVGDVLGPLVAILIVGIVLTASFIKGLFKR